MNSNLRGKRVRVFALRRKEEQGAKQLWDSAVAQGSALESSLLSPVHNNIFL